jgi:hypothetical protein
MDQQTRLFIGKKANSTYVVLGKRRGIQRIA